MIRASLPFTRLPGLVTRGCFKFKNVSFIHSMRDPSSVAARSARAGAAVAGDCFVAEDATRRFRSAGSSPRFFSASAAAVAVADDLTPTSFPPSIVAKKSVLNKLWQHIEAGEENAFYVVDTSAVEERYRLWMEHLPYVKPYYAVKCNPDPSILKTLARLGTGFDCASQAEIQEVLKLGVDPSSIIYANPCKQPSHIAFATQQKIDFMTFDGCDELTKMKRIDPDARVVLRLFVDDTHSQCPLGTKFGASLNDVPAILKHAKAIGSNVVGVSFHVGSGCSDASAYEDAVVRARKVFDIGASLGFNFELLDIGGGFPGDANAPISFESIASTLNSALSANFPLSSGVKIISEPGRFFAATSHTLAVNVIGRKLAPNSLAAQSIPHSSAAKAALGQRGLHGSTDPHYMYYVNDGLYGSFNCLLYDHAAVYPVPLGAESATNTYSASIWGPTCDGLDCIAKDIDMPVLDIGQWIYFSNMGAYTSAAGSHFNGFSPPEKIYFDSKEEQA
ncbi:hypothetical protein LEN26_002754 [Aphanomyces euteiches]|uniref:ornithine decarboxylase n=1 Tax=Aphanomyces euteiches TaxID=100861 RepID=A0A6G0XM36_9STRA|nr:hypothetical protein Ae201684_003140 [Aphanomyces euteiches]KAH9098736.1 hypothetical protein Ae201684P_017947 [Aphanomyces euteiches]KAH9113788.1 hypothetical protein AeMF1_012065 [Aphanomyces euteiches]KAH9152897.1 hypothetical protein AeRB84_004760 [Aphanomyces euteiches]KAH9158742.1 hypothetical protein LEN26_002754 [Aphanomyces euteiches]